jgi:type I restriction enzyme S subunit
MRAGWQTKTLGNLCDILDNRRMPITKCDRKAGPYPYYGATGILDYVDGYLFDEPLILVGEDGAKWASGDNTAFAVEGKCWVNNHAHVLRPHRSVLLDNWLIHFLVHSDLSEFVSGLTVPKLNQGSLREISLPVPPLPEQQRIVTLLDEAFDGIATAKANAEKNLENARAVFESHLQSVFTQNGEGWTRTTLGKATGGVFTGPFGSLLHKSDYVENGIPLVNPAHITDVGIEPDMRKTVSEATAWKLSNYIMRKGDVVIGRRGEMGRCALVTDIEDGWLCGTGSFYIKPSPRCDSGYLVRFLRSDACKRRLEKIAGGAVMPNLSNTDLRNLSFDLPSLEMQKTIGDEIDKVATETQRLESIYQQKLTALDELKKSLLAQAFNGLL